MGKRETTAAMDRPTPPPVAQPPAAQSRPDGAPTFAPAVDMLALGEQADEIFSRPRVTWTIADLQTARLAASVFEWERHQTDKPLSWKLERLSALGLQRCELQLRAGTAAEREQGEQAARHAAEELATRGEQIASQIAKLQAELAVLEKAAETAARAVETRQQAVAALRENKFQPMCRLDEIRAAEAEFDGRIQRPISRRRAEIAAIEARLTLDPTGPRDRHQAELLCPAAFVGGRFTEAPWRAFCDETRSRIAELQTELAALEADPAGPALLARIQSLRSFFVPE